MELGANPRRSSLWFLWIALALLGILLTALAGGIEGSRAQAPALPENDLLLEEHFDDGISRWTAFLNYWRLRPEQWYWGEFDGWEGSGAANHECCNDPNHEAQDAVLMYLGAGAEEWTDYRVEAKFNFHEGLGPVGLWVRGQYEPSDTRCQWMTGYYVTVGGQPDDDYHVVKIAQLQTVTDCWGAACDHPENLYCFNNPYLLNEVLVPGALTRDTWHTLVVEVRDARIKVWLDGELALDYTDPKEPFLLGTVGLKTYSAESISYDDVIVTGLLPLWVEKSAWPESLAQNGPITFTVVVSNSGLVTGTAELVTDALDPSFTFVEMVAGSDVMTPPQQISGTLVWAGPLAVSPLGNLTLKYRVMASLPGASRPCNWVEVLTADGIVGPAKACVVGIKRVFLPAIQRNYPPPGAWLHPGVPRLPR